MAFDHLMSRPAGNARFDPYICVFLRAATVTCIRQDVNAALRQVYKTVIVCHCTNTSNTILQPYQHRQ